LVANKSALSSDEVERAIYIDYEGNIDKAPTLLGWRVDGINYASIVEPTFATCAGRFRAKHVEHIDHATLAKQLLQRAVAEERRILSWSEHDLKLIQTVLPNNEKEQFLFLYKNAIKPMRSWYWRKYQVSAPDGSLSFFCNVTGFSVPDRFGIGIVGNGLRLIRSQLLEGRDYADLTPKARSSWVSVVRHNRLDLEGMEHVLRSSLAPLEKNQIVC
jgi:hypothetical protein